MDNQETGTRHKTSKNGQSGDRYRHKTTKNGQLGDRYKTQNN